MAEDEKTIFRYRKSKATQDFDIEEEFSKLKDTQDTLLREFRDLRAGLALVPPQKLSKAIPAVEEDVGGTSAERRYTENGVRVGDKAWCVYELELFAVHVAAYHQSDKVLTVECGSEEWEQDFSEVFPLTAGGKEAAEGLVTEREEDTLEKEAWKALNLIHALEGDLSVSALKELGNRRVTSMASMVGLSPFRDLKGVKGNERIKVVAKAAKEYRGAKGTEKLLNAAKRAVTEWEKVMDKRHATAEAVTQSLREKSKEVVARKNREEGRSLNDGARPTGPMQGDWILDGKDWYRIFTVPAKKGALTRATHSKTEAKKSFYSLRFKKLTPKQNTPIWEPIK